LGYDFFERSPDISEPERHKKASTKMGMVAEKVILFGGNARGRWVEHLYTEGGITYECISD
jgi:hypothetical protein